MSSYQQDLQKFKSYCAKCQGKCCHIKGHIPISTKEVQFIKKNYPQVKLSIVKSTNGQSYCIDIKNKCPFVNSKGCVLKEDKFLNCKIFPLVFIYQNYKINFSLFNDLRYCPYIKEITRLNKFKKYAIILASKELKSWTENEKKYFSDLTIQKDLIKL